MENIKVAIVGQGGRGRGLLKTCLSFIKGIEIVGLCDLYEDRIAKGVDLCKEIGGYTPKYCYTDYRKLLEVPEIDCILVPSSWEAHIPVCIDAMKAGKYVASEVGGAYNIQQCYDLVRTYEETRVPVMMLENCCYGKNEMLVLNMVKKGLFGELIHCEGGYHHDLRDEVSLGHENRHYRLDNYLNRDGEVYPTHELGPMAKYLNINRGNRMTMLTSMSSRNGSVNNWIVKNRGEDFENAHARFAMGDVVTTCIKCAHGETIVLTHDTTIPRAYSRGNVVQGINGTWSEDCGGILLDGMGKGYSYEHKFIPVEEFYNEHMHPLWKEYIDNGVVGGHDGMDYLCLNAFFDAVRNHTEVPIDAYDMASWMSITCLSEDSIAMGSMPVAIPDFTAGKWVYPRPITRSKYCLDEVCWDCFNA